MRLENISILAWLEEHHIKTEKGTPISFRDHFFLFDIYRDFSPKQVIFKAAQVGFSTLAILKSIWLAKHKGIDIIYTLPSANDVVDFVSGKTNRIIAQNPVLQDYVKDKDSVEQKRVGENVIYYRGTMTEKAALMVSSDLNIHDEEDQSNQAIVQQYASRLQHSKNKWEWHFSNPSVMGNGVSRDWDISDQKHWFIRCGKCLKEQYLSWPGSIDMEKREFVCKKCGKVLSQEERRVGRWVKKYKNREFSGYWIPLLIAPWISASEIVKYYETKSKEYFYNFVLGLPYIGEGNTVTADVLFRNLTATINDQKNVVIGCDSGLLKHYVLGNREGLFYYGKTESWETIESLLKKYDRSVAVIDALPDLTEPRKLREKYPGRVFLCHYAKDRKTMQFIRWGKGDESGNVVVDRNRTMQLLVDQFADRRIALQGTLDDWQDFYAHWKTLYRVTETDSLGVPQIEWKTSDGNDHWAHATLYWLVGMDKYRESGAILEPGAPEFPVSAPIEPDGTMKVKPPKPIFESVKSDDWRD